MTNGDLHVVTGAFGYTGKYITRRLLEAGKRVRTLTGHPGRPSPFGDRVEVVAFRFDDEPALARSLEGAAVLYNTYWVRFPRGTVTYDASVENTKKLFQAAARAGVRRVVHVSITNASPGSPLPYFRGKGILEQALRGSGVPHAIIRPTVIFGAEDILINNIAWLLRRFPVFAVPGRGDYRLQPVFVEDVAEMAVAAAGREENEVIDAVGPETFTFEELVRLIRRTVRGRARIVHLEPGLALLLAAAVGRLVGDVVLTRDEVEGLMANLLVSDKPSVGRTRLTRWLEENAGTVGRAYASELRRHYR